MKMLNKCALLFVLTSVVGSSHSLYAQSATQWQEQFFAAIATENPEELLALCRDDLRDLIDEPVLAAWMQAFHGSVGEYQKLDTSDFRVNYSISTSGRGVSTSGTVICSKGNATSELVAENGKLVSWRADSKLLPQDWFEGPLTTDLYHERGEQFITLCFSGKTDAAFDKMHPALQEVVTREILAEMISTQDDGGELQSLTFQKAEMDFSEGQRLNVLFAMELENVTKLARIQFQFVGMQGHLIAFRFWDE